MVIHAKMSRTLKAEFADSEYAAYEDDHHPETGPHPYLVASRKGDGLTIETDEELRSVWVALCSGTFQLHHFRAACKVADQLKPLVEAAPWAGKVLSVWPYPSGY